jgi:hypothetical protein
VILRVTFTALTAVFVINRTAHNFRRNSVETRPEFRRKSDGNLKLRNFKGLLNLSKNKLKIREKAGISKKKSSHGIPAISMVRSGTVHGISISIIFTLDFNLLRKLAA